MDNDTYFCIQSYMIYPLVTDSGACVGACQQWLNFQNALKIKFTKATEYHFLIWNETLS